MDAVHSPLSVHTIPSFPIRASTIFDVKCLASKGEDILGDLTFTHTHPMYPRMPCTPLQVRASSPASQSKLASSPASQSKLASSPASQSRLASSPASQCKLAPPPASQSRLASSPASQSKLASSPASQSTLASLPASQSRLASSPASQSRLAPSRMSNATMDFFNESNSLSTSFSVASDQQWMTSSANYCRTSKSLCPVWNVSDKQNSNSRLQYASSLYVQ